MSLDALVCEETGEREIRFVDRMAGAQDVEQEMLDSADREAIRTFL